LTRLSTWRPRYVSREALVDPAVLFIYGLVLTLVLFIDRDALSLALIGVPNALIGFVLGWRKYKVLIALFLVGLVGLGINALLLTNVGPAVLSVGPLVVRAGAVNTFVTVGLRITGIAGVAFLFVSLVDPALAVRSLERELRLPKGVCFALAYALRLIDLMSKDLREVQGVRVLRGYRSVPITPSDIRSVLTPLLSVGYERALWVGIAAELRGFRLRKVSKEPLRIGWREATVLTLLALQILTAIAGMLGYLVPYIPR